MRFKVVKAVAFLLIGALLFSGFWSLFCIKQEKRMERLKRLPRNSVDVMFVGSSHAFMNIDPSVLYRESGISAYVLGCGSQPIWQTYYHLKESLRSQKPKVVFVECYKLCVDKDFSSNEVTVNACSGMSFSRNLLDMLNASVEDKGEMANFVLQFPWFHSRYNEIDRTDYLPDYGDVYYKDYLGYFAMTKIVKDELPQDLDQVTKKKKISRKNRYYLERIVELSKEEGFDLVLLITPFCRLARKKQRIFNSLAEYAAKEGVPFLNCNLLYGEIGLDDRRDFSVTSHLSLTGAEKMSMYLNDYINARWTLPDHRGDERYAVWDRNLELMELVRKYPGKWRKHLKDGNTAES